MSGATRSSYWIAQYLKDVTVYMIFGLIQHFVLVNFAKPPDGSVWLFTQFAIAQPLFLYTITYFFTNVVEKKGTVAQIIVIALSIIGD